MWSVRRGPVYITVHNRSMTNFLIIKCYKFKSTQVWIRFFHFWSQYQRYSMLTSIQGNSLLHSVAMLWEMSWMMLASLKTICVSGLYTLCCIGQYHMQSRQEFHHWILLEKVKLDLIHIQCLRPTSAPVPKLLTQWNIKYNTEWPRPKTSVLMCYVPPKNTGSQKVLFLYTCTVQVIWNSHQLLFENS